MAEKKHIVIIGAGIGGMATAYMFRKWAAKRIGKDLEITVISNKPYFAFTPAFPHLALGWRKVDDIIVPLEGLLKRFNINFIPQAAERIDPDANKVTLKNGETVGYDYLIVATGPKLNFVIEGMEEHNHSVCTEHHAQELHQAFEAFLEDPGPIAVGAIPGTSCFGPAYEFAFMVHYELKRRKLRHKIPIYFITSEPYVGHLGLANIGNLRRYMEDKLAEKDIRYFTNVKVTRFEADKVVFEDLDGHVHEVPAKFKMFMPRFSGTDVVASAGDKVANPKNKMIIVNKCFQNPSYPNIYGVGVITAIPPVEQTPVPTGAPKTGHMIEGMAEAAVLNILADIDNKSERYTPTLAAICIADFGDEGVAMMARPVFPPREEVKTIEGKTPHMLKTAFEKYFLWKIKRGTINPSFEEAIVNRFFNIELVEPCTVCEGPPGSRWPA